MVRRVWFPNAIFVLMEHVGNKATFRVPPAMNKLEIAEYLTKVRTAISEGKKTRGAHGIMKRPDFKKAFVTLGEDSTTVGKPSS